MENTSTYECFGPLNKTAVPMETIEVTITTELFGDFASAFVTEATRVAPLISQQCQLTADEVEDYIKFLVSERVKCVHDKCDLWRKLKLLYIPSWIQFNLRMIGECVIRQYGLKVVPQYDEEVIDFDRALEISNKIGMFEDVMQIVQDAMPRSKSGDQDVMTTALIAGYMRSIHPVAHPISTYVAAFMGMKLREEAAMKVLYRIQYDDIDYIRAALLAQREIFK